MNSSKSKLLNEYSETDKNTGECCWIRLLSMLICDNIPRDSMKAISFFKCLVINLWGLLYWNPSCFSQMYARIKLHWALFYCTHSHTHSHKHTFYLSIQLRTHISMIMNINRHRQSMLDEVILMTIAVYFWCVYVYVLMSANHCRVVWNVIYIS